MEKEMEKTNVGEMLRFDGLKEAELITGKSYKEDQETERLGFANAILNSKILTENLIVNEDTNKSSTMEQFIEVNERLGFEKIYEKTTKCTKENYESHLKLNEEVTQYYYWHPTKYILSVFEGYDNNQKINSAVMNYAIKEKTGKNLRMAISSGVFDKDHMWNGSHDTREAMSYKIQKLEEVGEFMKWTEKHFLWLLTYLEKNVENYNYEKINQEVLNNFPKEVLEAMCENRE